jgi:hypothetical protein
VSGIKSSCNRPKVAKHLRSATNKKFKNDDPEAKKRYAAKMAARATRKLKKGKGGHKPSMAVI